MDKEQTTERSAPPAPLSKTAKSVKLELTNAAGSVEDPPVRDSEFWEGNTEGTEIYFISDNGGENHRHSDVIIVNVSKGMLQFSYTQHERPASSGSLLIYSKMYEKGLDFFGRILYNN